MRAILTYHSIDASGSPVSCHPDVFRSHVRWMASGRVRVVTLDSLVALPDSADAVAVTFDDGFVNFRDVALPLLHAHGLPSTVFVVADHTGRTNAWRGTADRGIPVLPLLDWAAIAALPERGVAIGSHGRTHRELTALGPAALDEEVAGSASVIARHTGVHPTTFAYPYGAIDRHAAAAVAAHYRYGCTTEFRVLDARARASELPRLDAYYFSRSGLFDAWGTVGFARFVSRRRQLRRVRAAARGASKRVLHFGDTR
jgi:peptidoglycan/xylan/chitin deacetylase (PgdA/CDA1 family)